MNELELNFRIEPDTAWELAQFAKRLGFQACYELTEAHLTHDERLDKAYLIIHGMDLVAGALARAGCAPR